jgi:hypothetical protein
VSSQRFRASQESWLRFVQRKIKDFVAGWFFEAFFASIIVPWTKLRRTKFGQKGDIMISLVEISGYHYGNDCFYSYYFWY